MDIESEAATKTLLGENDDQDVELSAKTNVESIPKKEASKSEDEKTEDPAPSANDDAAPTKDPETKSPSAKAKTTSASLVSKIENGGFWYWLPDARDGYKPCRLVENWSKKVDRLMERERTKAFTGASSGSEIAEKKTQTFLVDGTDEIEVQKAHHGQRLTRFNVSPSEDLVSMQEIAESFILNNLKTRFQMGSSFTHCGPRNLIYVSGTASSPQSNLRSVQESFDTYKATPFNSAQYAPHVHSLAHRVYEKCIEKPRESEDADYAIVFQGSRDSGIETLASSSLRYLCTVGTMPSDNVSSTDAYSPATKLLLADALVRAFGFSTSSTGYHAHVSRITNIKFDEYGVVAGASMQYYMLDQRRLTHCASNERNFNIFYQFFEAPIPFRRKHACMDIKRFGYLKNTVVERDLADVDGFKTTIEALKLFKFEKDFTFAVLATILHLGNINFTYNDVVGATVIKSEAVKIAADLLIVDVEVLKRALCAGAENVQEAIANRDALARHIYAVLFDYIFLKINEQLDCKTTFPSIKLVQSEGLSQDGVGSFSQLSSNFIAEKIYGQYTKSMFNAEEEFLKRFLYGQSYTLPVDFDGNSETLDLVEGRGGILQTAAVANDADDFLARIGDKQSIAFGTFDDVLAPLNAKIKALGGEPYRATNFVVRHFRCGDSTSADTVYDSVDIVSKCNARPSPEIQTMFAETSIAKVLGVAKNRGISGMDVRDQAENFESALPLSKTTAYYVHCIRAVRGEGAEDARDGVEAFDGAAVLRQLRSLQISELAKTIKKGMPYKRTHKEFLCRYFSLAAKSVFATVNFTELGSDDKDTALYCKRLQTALSKSPLMRNFKQSGISKGGSGFVFYNKQSTNKTLERFRNKEVSSSVDVLVRSLKTMIFRDKVKNYVAMITAMKRNVESKNLETLRTLVAKAKSMSSELEPQLWSMQALFVSTVRSAQSCIEHLEKQNEVSERLATLLAKDPYDNYKEYRELMDMCTSLNIEVPRLFEARRRFKVADDRRRAEKIMEEGLETCDGKKINDAWELSMKDDVKQMYGEIFDVADNARYNEVVAKIKEESAHFGDLEEIIQATSIRGSPGNLNTSFVDNSKLDKAIVHLKTKMIQSKAGKVLIRSAHFCHQMRKNVLEKNDKLLKEWIERWTRFETIRDIDAEFKLVREDVQNREVLALLKREIQVGRITGSFGNINIDNVEVDKLDAAIQRALAIPDTERLREVSEMLFASQAIVRVRRELIAALASSKKLESFRREEDAEAKKLADLLEKSRETESAASEIEDAKIREVRIELDERRRSEQAKARAHLQQLSRSRVHEKNDIEMENKHSWERLKFTLLEANAALLHTSTRSEVQLAQIVWDEHDISEMLIRALQNGSAGRNENIGDMDVDKIVTHQLRAALRLAAKAAELSEHTRLLRQNAEVIVKLRDALKIVHKGGGWEDVRRIISLYRFVSKEDPTKQMVLPQSVLEIDRAFQEWQFYHVVSCLESALASGAATGRPGSLNYDAVSTDELADAVRVAERANVPAKRCENMFRLGLYTLRIRNASRTAGEGRREPLIDLCMEAIGRGSGSPEIISTLEDQNHLLIVETLAEAFKIPGIGGTTEELRVDPASVRALSAAIARVERVNCDTEVSKEIIEAARYILAVREAVLLPEPSESFGIMQGKWRILHDYVNDAKRGYCGCTDDGSIDENCLTNDNLPLVANHCLNRMLQASLSKALASGRATGEPGNIDLRSISTAELDQKIQLADRYLDEDDQMLKTSELLVAARDIRTLRTMLKASAYGEVERVLMKLDGERVSPICLDEIHLAHREVEYHIVSKELREAVRSGKPTGDVGVMDTDDIDLTLLDRAIPHAIDIEFESESLRTLLIGAILVRRLRAALKFKKWKAVTRIVAFTEQKTVDLDASILEEIERARQEVVARATVAELEIALEKKNASAIRRYLESAKSSPIASAESAQKTMERAEIYLEKFEECREELAHLTEDEQLAYNVPDFLKDVLAEADSVGYVSADVEKAEQLKREIDAYTQEARRAIATKKRSVMRKMKNKLEARRVMIPELGKLNELLALPESVLLQKQLVAAMREEDESEIARCTCRMKKLYFQQHGFSDFALRNFRRLKSAHEFVSNDLVHEKAMDHYSRWEDVQDALERKRSGMLTFTSEPIHTSLTHLPRSMPKSIPIHAYSVFLKFISDAPGPDVEFELAKVLYGAVRMPELRDELYIQVIKLMTNNPSTTSVVKAWRLFDLCLLSFPPTEDFENYLEAFIRNRHDSESRLRKLHLMLYIGRKGELKESSQGAIVRMIKNYKRGEGTK